MTTPAPPASTPSSGGGNIWTRKLGPLPMWGWMGVGLAGALAYTSWRKDKTAAASTTSTTGSASGTSDTAAENTVPQFVNQTFTTVTPPATTTPASGGTGTSTTPPPTTTAAQAYPAPTGQHISENGTTSAAFSWGQVAGVATSAKWHVQVLDANSGKVVYDNDSVPGTATSVTATGLKPNTHYKWRVSAVPNGQWSTEQTFITR